MRSPIEMVELFRRQGLKVTPQRELIFEILWRAGHHPTAESVYAEARTQMPTMSLRTVYQTLNDLAAMGELHQLDLGTGSSPVRPQHRGPPPSGLHRLRAGAVTSTPTTAASRSPPARWAVSTSAPPRWCSAGLCHDCRTA